MVRNLSSMMTNPAFQHEEYMVGKFNCEIYEKMKKMRNRILNTFCRMHQTSKKKS